MAKETPNQEKATVNALIESLRQSTANCRGKNRGYNILKPIRKGSNT
jgi:hypothetical protein